MWGHLFNIWNTRFSISDTFLCQYQYLGSQMLVFKALFGSETGKQRVRGIWPGSLLECPALRRELSSGGCSAPASPGWCWMNTGKVCFSVPWPILPLYGSWLPVVTVSSWWALGHLGCVSCFFKSNFRGLERPLW